MDWQRVGFQAIFLVAFTACALAFRALMERMQERDRWYAILPINPGAPTRREGVVVLQVRPKQEGYYTYYVETQDVAGVRSNVLTQTIRVDSPPTRTLCPPSDPILPTRPNGELSAVWRAGTPIALAACGQNTSEVPGAAIA
jgi:hypothetical protein